MNTGEGKVLSTPDKRANIRPLTAAYQASIADNQVKT